MKRNASIDFLRALMMLGIVLLHIVASPERWETWRSVACMLLPCVVGFVFISGYFSVKFSWRKLAALYGTAFWCLGVIWVISGASFGEMVEMFKDKWFLHAYAILMCGAPLVAVALEKSQKSVIPFLCVVFGWGFLSHMAFVHHYIPQMPEFDAKSGVTLIGIYCAARIYRLNEGRFDSVRSYWYGLAILPLLALCTFGQGWFGNYNSPVALLFVLCVFHLVKQIRLPNVMRRLMIFLAPSIFSVYILHANQRAYGWMNGLVQQVPLPQALSFVLVALFVFVLCCLVDLPRRAVVGLICKKMCA